MALRRVARCGVVVVDGRRWEFPPGRPVIIGSNDRGRAPGTS